MESEWTHPIVKAAPKSTEYWGYHATFDISDCNREQIGSEDNHRAFLKELVKEIDMVAYGEPVLAHFANHDPSKGGYTIIQMIETSSITGHFVDSNGDAYVDVFSCKPFSIATASKVIQKYYSPSCQVPHMMYRKAL